MDVCVLLGSKSDLDRAKDAFKIFNEMNVKYDVHVASAHRTPEMVREIAEKSDCSVFLVFAGLSAMLPGFVASHTTKPVIGVPLSGKVPFDSLLSMIQMPRGIPVAVVGVDNVINGALMCVQILALSKKEFAEKIEKYRREMREKVMRDDEYVRRTLQP